MQVVDTNFILRYLLQDDTESYKEAEKVFLSDEEIFIPGEIIAEIVYVMKGVYKISKEDITNSICNLIQNPNIILYDKDVVDSALKIFSDTNLDYPDCLLYCYNKLRDYTLHTFDKGLKKKL